MIGFVNRMAARVGAVANKAGAFIKRNVGKVAAALTGAAAAGVQSQAALDTNITGIVTDLTTFFGSIQTLTISVVVFGLAIGYAKLLGRK